MVGTRAARPWVRVSGPPALVAALLALQVAGPAGAWVYPPYGTPPPGTPGQPPAGWGPPPPPQPQAAPRPEARGGPPAAAAPQPPLPRVAPTGPQTAPGQYRPLAPGNARGLPPTHPAAASAPYGAPYAPPGARYPATPYPPGSGPVSGWPGPYGPGAEPGRQPGAPSAPPGGASRPWSTPWSQTAEAPPRLEWAIDDTRPYVQQTVLLRLRLISTAPLATADPELAARGDALLEQVAGPTTASRVDADGGRELVTEFVYALTPLSPGDLELPAPRVSGTGAGASGRYSAVAAAPVRLKVRPPMATVQPWLPLRSLALSATFDRPEHLTPGQPVTMILESNAVGAGAAVLPSLEEQLKTPDFRIYREQTLTEGGLSKDGLRLTGRRTEYYTLVPQGGGNLRLPELRVPWWNLDTEARQVAILPMRTLDIAGAEGPFRLPASLRAMGAGWDKVLLPVAGLLLVLAGYWAAVLWHQYPGRAKSPDPRRLVPAARRAVRRSGVRAARLRRRLAPEVRALAARVGAALPRLLPAGTRLRLCLRAAAGAPDPETWCHRLDASGVRFLGVTGLGGTARLTRALRAACPWVDPDRLAAHLARLERARYGRESLAFTAWKRELSRLLRRRLGGPRRHGDRRRPGLPALNPRPS